MLAVVRPVEVERRPERDDTIRVNALVTAKIMAFDMVHVDGFGHRLGLIQVAQVTREVGKIADAIAVALEMRVVDCVESNERRKQALVGFGRTLAGQITPRRQCGLERIECRKKIVERALIRFLRASKAAAIDTVV